MSQVVCFYCGLPAKWKCDHVEEVVIDALKDLKTGVPCDRMICSGCRRVMGRGVDHCLKAHAPPGAPPG